VFQSLVFKVLNYCHNASSHIDYDYLYGDDHIEANEYSFQYTAIRQQEESESFVDDKDACGEYAESGHDKKCVLSLSNSQPIVVQGVKRPNQEGYKSDMKRR
jgi:hypothetical protein